MKFKGHRDGHNKETTRDERLQVINLRNAQFTWSRVSRETGLNESTCRPIYERYKLFGTPSNRKCSGRPVVLSESDKQQLKVFVISSKRTRRLSWEEITEEMGFQCSWQTVKHAMSSMGYYKRVPRKKHHLLSIVLLLLT